MGWDDWEPLLPRTCPTVDPTATPAAVDAIWPNNPGCELCCGAGCATEEAGLDAGAGTFDGRAGAGAGLDGIRGADILPPPPDLRGILDC